VVGYSSDPPNAQTSPSLPSSAPRTRLHHPWVTAPETQDAVEQWLTRTSGERAAALVACRREDSAIVGVFNLSEIVRGAFQSSYASYYAHAAYSGNGYMTEGLRLVLQHAFGPLGLHRVESNIQPGNAASIALVRRVGFRFEGVCFGTSRSAAGGETTNVGRSPRRIGAASAASSTRDVGRTRTG
jgi:RimJ/RimL family protein N-acetyltransferase